MRHLYFVRHGQSQANVDHIYAGQVETPLTELGRNQAAAAGQQAKDLTIDHIISSTLSRAYDTARIIAETVGYPTEQIERSDLLIERDYGSLAGKPWDFTIDIDTFDGAESLQAIYDRGHQAWAYLQSLPFDNILVVSHGTFYQALQHAIDPSAKLIEGNDVPNAKIVTLV